MSLLLSTVSRACRRPLLAGTVSVAAPLVSTTNITASTQHHPLQPSLVRRWKHPSKTGQHLQKLDELAHTTSRQEAQVRRQKKKDRKAAKKKKGHDDEETTAASTVFAESDIAEHVDDDEHYFDDDDEHLDEDESTLPDLDQVQARMQIIVDRFAETLKGIRGAEPTPELFDDVIVDAYGSHTPLKSVAQVVIVSNTLATATCFDPALSKDVSNAIRNKLLLNPSVQEGGLVNIPIPRVSLETRQATATLLQKKTESFRQALRKVRRQSLERVKLGVAGKLEHVSKDEAFRVQQAIQAMTEQMTDKLNDMAEKKHTSIMAV